MAHYRRRRPRKQPRSVMSSPGRVFDVRDNSIPEEKPTPAKRGRKKKRPFAIAFRVDPDHPMARMFNRWGEWRVFRRYRTQEDRRKAIAALSRNARGILQYRLQEDLG